MKVILKFQSSYDKYLFEGIIPPEDLERSSGSSGNIGNIGPMFYGSSVPIPPEETVCVYVLNTLDHNIKIEPDNPDNIITKFFSKMNNTPVKNILLISIQHIKVFHNVIEYFTKLEKAIHPKDDVVVYTISSLTVKHMGKNETKRFDEYGKHIFIDLSLALNAIELFKRSKFEGIGYDLRNHHDKTIISKSIGFGSKIHIPEIRSGAFKYIREFLYPDIEKQTSVYSGDRIFDYKSLIHLIPKFNYRIYDKLETFLRKISSGDLYDSLKASLPENPYDSLYNVCIIKKRNSGDPDISFKNLLYMSILPWNLIFFSTDGIGTEVVNSDGIGTEIPNSETTSLYEQLSQIYNDKSFEISRKELMKLNSDYSLLRDENETWESMKYNKKFLIPHIMIDDYESIKTYLKKLEDNLKVDNIHMNILET